MTVEFGKWGLNMRAWVLGIILALLMVVPVGAQRPNMSIYVNWTPDEQLTSIPNDNRFVEAQIYAQGNVQFWAVDVQCSIGSGNELELVDMALPENVWGQSGADYIMTPGVGSLQATYNNPANFGRLNFTISRVGVTNAPVGVNGRDTTTLLATARFRTQNNDRDRRVVPNCRLASFLDRDGNLITRGRQTRINNLEVRIGYTLQGTVTRQGTRDSNNIEISCVHDPFGTPSTPKVTYTNFRGNFTFGNALTTSGDVLREYGLYECTFTSANPETPGVRTADTAILQSTVLLDLNTPTYTLLPVVLRAGDFNGDNQITTNTMADFDAITSQFGTSVANQYQNGDANGDRRLDESDLAIVAGNVGYRDAQTNGTTNYSTNDILLAEHVVYGLGRDYDARASFPNSKIWWGQPQAGQVNELVGRSRTRDFWPQVSPDGTEVAYVQENGRTGVFELAIADTSRGFGRPVRFPREFNDTMMLAPSWSPDGNRIAFICTADTPVSGINYNEGDICIVNRDDRLGTTLFRLSQSLPDADFDGDGDPYFTEIFPPAWMEYTYTYDHDGDAGTPLVAGRGYLLVYAQNNTLRYYDLANEQAGTLPGFGAGVDMPTVVNHHSGETYLVYRADGSNGKELRVARLTYTADQTSIALDTVASVGTTDHVKVTPSTGTEPGTPDAYDTDYYDVNPVTLDIMAYDDAYQTLFRNFRAVDRDGGSVALTSNWEYTPGSVDNTFVYRHRVDGAVGHPFWDATAGPGNPVSGSDAVNTRLHAERMTFDWIP